MRSGHAGRKWRTILTVVVVVFLGLGALGWSWGRRPPAAADAHRRAVALFNAMETYAGTTALDQADDVASEDGVKVMVARNTRDGHEIVLAVTGHATTAHNYDIGPLFPTSGEREYSATRCFRWTSHRAWGTADQVDCPAHRSIDPATAPKAHPISSKVEARVRRALHDTADPDRIRERLTGVHVQVRRIGTTTALALAGTAGYRDGRAVPECLLGFRKGGRVDVWLPRTAQIEPGELACSPATALLPEARTAPH